MNNKKNIFCIFVILSLFTSCDMFSVNKKCPDGNLISCEYSYYGTIKYPLDYYKIEKDKNGNTTICNVSSGGDTTIVNVSKDILNKVENAIKENKMYKYKERYTSFMRVLDGNSWAFEVEYDNNKKIYSHGENAYPRNYEGLNIVKQILANAYKEATDTTSMPKGYITSLKFVEHEMIAEPTIYFEIKCNNNKFTLKYIDNNAKYHNMKLTSEDIQQIRNIIRQYRVYKYKSYYCPDEEVLDGYSWNLEYQFSTGEKYKSSGGNAYPENYGLSTILNFLKSKTETDK